MAPAAPERTAPAAASLAPTTSVGELALRAEREFLTLSLAGGRDGHDYLSRPADDHFSSELHRRARDHLVEHFEDPLTGLPEDDPALGALVTDVAFAAQERPLSEEHVLRMSVLQLEQRGIQRAIARASEEGDLARQVELAQAEQKLRTELGAVMGQMA
jgi:hypothetical protein